MPLYEIRRCSAFSKDDLKTFCELRDVKDTEKMNVDEMVVSCCAGSSKYIKSEIGRLVNLNKMVTYKKEAWKKISDEESLGVILSKFVNHSGDNIIEVAREALTDSNYHGFAKYLEDEWWEREGGEEAD